MSNIPFGTLPEVQQPWGFEGVKREQRGVYGDSRNFYVQPDHIEATDANSGEDPAHPLATVARAIVLARAYMGDTIYVMSSDSWQYGTNLQLGVRESVVVPADKPGLTIIGVGRGGKGVYWQPAATGDWCITVRALDTTIKGFTFWGPAIVANGVLCDWAAPATFGDNTWIQDCFFTDGVAIGIQLIFAYNVIIERCHFDRVDTAAIYADPADSAPAYCEIRDNWFHDCALAMAISEADSFLIENNKIYNGHAQAAALATNEGINTSAGQNNMVVDNFFSCVLPAAANGDWDDLNSGDATDAWINNHCLNGDAVTTPT